MTDHRCRRESRCHESTKIEQRPATLRSDLPTFPSVEVTLDTQVYRVGETAVRTSTESVQSVTKLRVHSHMDYKGWSTKRIFHANTIAERYSRVALALMSERSGDGRFLAGVRSSRFIDLTGQRFGRLVGLQVIELGSNGLRWLFRCDCGSDHAAAGYHVRKGRITSCGCFAAERSRLPREARPDFKRALLEERFWRYVSGGSVEDCWFWTGVRGPGGYGRIRSNVDSADQGRTVQAPRVAWQLLRGDIPAELVIDHLCCNPPCVNPWHLEPVSVAENNRRYQNKKRARRGY